MSTTAETIEEEVAPKSKTRFERREADLLWYVRLRLDDHEGTLIDGEHMRGPFELKFQALDWLDKFKMKARATGRSRKT